MTVSTAANDANRFLSRPAFTLIELLVVVTVIVVLLSLLVPAMNQAVYQAELVTCAARQHGAASGVLTYAMGNKRFYPHRRGPAEVNWLPMYVCSNDRDDRSTIFSAIQPKLLLDPFSGKIDLTTQNGLRQVIYANYSMWFSWRYKPTGNNGKEKDREKGMYKLGDRFTWLDTYTDPAQPLSKSYNLLLSDWSVIRELPEWTNNPSAHGGHPDRDEQILEFVYTEDSVENAAFYEGQGQTLTTSFWRNQNTGVQKRGFYDSSYAYDDGSVLRFNDIAWNDRQRMAFIPEGNNTVTGAGWGHHVPKQ